MIVSCIRKLLTYRVAPAIVVVLDTAQNIFRSPICDLQVFGIKNFVTPCLLAGRYLTLLVTHAIMAIAKSCRGFKAAHAKANPGREAALPGFFVLTCPCSVHQATCTIVADYACYDRQQKGVEDVQTSSPPLCCQIGEGQQSDYSRNCRNFNLKFVGTGAIFPA